MDIIKRQVPFNLNLLMNGPVGLFPSQVFFSPNIVIGVLRRIQQLVDRHQCPDCIFLAHADAISIFNKIESCIRLTRIQSSPVLGLMSGFLPIHGFCFIDVPLLDIRPVQQTWYERV
ncbi:hypothetical protein Pyn_41130 [Prunus yedoensis var. nudiflora]|uniref:Uncharacterized protein n=1 Tax=Prunus yedoensis var. nudiflora TaxID=2094558 RepID=A0A314UX59_PRUYE|nr:hypothetical protein Pyn_41130 [Prunus yedoensis var. nudiflora]